MKKISSLVIVLVMLLSMCVTVHADSVCYIGDDRVTGQKFNKLTDALFSANGETVHLTSDITLSEGNIVAKKVTIDGGSQYKITLDGDITWLNVENVTFKNVTINLNKHAFRITQNSGVSILTLGEGTIAENGFAPNGGAAIVNQGATLIMEKGSLVRNSETYPGSGGGIFVNGGSLIMNGGTVENCTSGGSSGGIVISEAGKLVLSGDATVRNNKINDGSIRNIKLNNPSSLRVKGTLTGEIGIAIDGAKEGFEFGSIEGSASGLDKIVSDQNKNLCGSAKDGKIVFAKKEAAVTGGEGAALEPNAASGPACYVGNNTKRKYDTLDDAINKGAGQPITLLRDAEMNGENIIAAEVKINGNGYTLKFKQRPVFLHSCEFTFENIRIDLGGKYMLMSSTSEIILKEGAVIENGSGTSGGAVSIGKNAIFIMEEGSAIKNCKSSMGGAIYANGTAILLGGTIENCTDTPIYSAANGKVYISEKANLNGGKVKFEAEEKYITADEVTEIIKSTEPAYRLLPKTAWIIDANSGKGSSPAEAAKAAIDGDPTTFWHSGYEDKAGTITSKDNPPFNLDITLPEKTVISGIRFTPRIDGGAGTPTKIRVYADMDGELKEIGYYEYSVSGAARTEEFITGIAVSRIRVQIVDGLGAYGTMAEIDLVAEMYDKHISETYDEYIKNNTEMKLYPIEKNNLMSVDYVGNVWTSHVASGMIDGLESFFQGTPKSDGDYSFNVDLGAEYTLSAISYLPRQEYPGFWVRYRIFASTDGNEYEEVASAIHRDYTPNKHFVYFDYPVTARYYRFVIDENNTGFISCTELDFYESYEAMQKRLEESKEHYTLQIGNNVISSHKETKTLDVVPYINSDFRTLIPLRGLLELMGAEVIWEEDNQSITIIKGDLKLYLQINYRNVSVTTESSGVTVTYTLDTMPIIKDSRTFVPIRFVSEQLGYDVAWNGETQTVEITK